MWALNLGRTTRLARAAPYDHGNPITNLVTVHLTFADVPPDERYATCAGNAERLFGFGVQH